MLKRAQVDHVLRAAAGITGRTRFVVIGTGAVSATAKQLPLAMMLTSELDLYPDGAGDPDAMAELIGVTIGNASPFHRIFGYDGDGVTPRTAILPTGWRERATEYTSPAAPGVVALCVEAHDIAVAKLCAWREKDRAWISAGLRHGVLQAPRLRDALSVLTDGRAPPRDELERRLAG